MSDYCKIGIDLAYSPNSDYSDPEETLPGWLPMEIADLAQWQRRTLSVPTGAGTSVTISMFNTIKAFALKNLDPTNFLTITYKIVGDATVCYAKIPAGGWILLGGLSPSTVIALTADTAAVSCEFILAGT